VSAVIIDGALFLSVAAQVLRHGHQVRFRARGHSMRPAIGDGDTITIGPVDPASLVAGDIILYHACERPLVHRVVAVRAVSPSELEVITCGDCKAAVDAPVGREQVLGKVVGVERRFEPSRLAALVGFWRAQCGWRPVAASSRT
jgi:signal peptidase I